MLKIENKNIKNLDLTKAKFSLSNHLLSYFGGLEEESSKNNPILKIKLEEEFSKQEIIGFNLLYAIIKANDSILHPSFNKPKSHKQWLNLDSNILFRETTYNVDGVNITIESTKFLDENQAIIYHQYSFFTDKEINLDFYHGIEDNSLNKDLKITKISSGNHEKLVSAKYQEKLKIKHMMIYKKNFRHKNHNKKNQSIEHYKINAVPNRKYNIIHYAGILFKNEKLFRKELKKRRNKGFKAMLNSHKKKWSELFFESKINIISNQKVNNLVNYSIYQMLTNIPNKFGMIDGNYNRDSWLKDIFVSKFYLNTSLKYARKILKRRIDDLVIAKSVAKKLKFKGALYLDELEEFNHGFRQLYLNGLIAYSLDQYYESTHDISILSDGGLLMLMEICNFYVDYAKLNSKKTRYDILNVSNIDNTIQNIDNHSLTNYLIKNSFKLLNKYTKLYKKHDRLKFEELINHNKLKNLFSKVKTVNKKLYFRGYNNNYIYQLYQGFYNDLNSSYFEMVNDKINITNDLLLLFILFPQEFADFIIEKNKTYYQDKFVDSNYNKLLSSLVTYRVIDEDNLTNFLDSVSINKPSLYINNQGINLGISGTIYYYIVYHLAKLRIDNHVLTIDSLLPKDIRRIEFNLKHFNKQADIKIKRNSARLEWVNK
ncbi:MAG: hypothetical protein ACQERX_04175 [Bacillota bacterium]